MEHIRQALDRAKRERSKATQGPGSPTARDAVGSRANGARQEQSVQSRTADGLVVEGQVVQMDQKHLHEHRIVAHEFTNPYSKYYDMLRTQVLKELGTHGARTLAVTSPKPDCGKTVTAINLALSLARGSEDPILFVDVDLRRPMVADYLGIKPRFGIADIANGQCGVEEALLVPELCNYRLRLLAAPRAIANPAKLLMSSSMINTIAELRSDPSYKLIIFDLPPMLSSDDFLAFAPQVEQALLIAATGRSTSHELAECKRLMPEGMLLGCALNMAREEDSTYGSYH